MLKMSIISATQRPLLKMSPTWMCLGLPVFAEGLASSYEAFLHTRKQRLEKGGKELIDTCTDIDDDSVIAPKEDSVVAWYLDQLQNSISSKKVRYQETHPKVAATVQKALELWKSGEKVLIFCHYIATGEILQRRVDQALDAEIYRVAKDNERRDIYEEKYANAGLSVVLVYIDIDNDDILDSDEHTDIQDQLDNRIR